MNTDHVGASSRRVRLKSYLFPLLILSGIILGSVVGMIFGHNAAVIKPFGDVFLYLLFTIVTPIVLILITSAVANIADLRRLGKILGATICIFVLLGLVASLLMLIGVSVFPPAEGVHMELPEYVDASSGMFSAGNIVDVFFVPDFVDILSKEHMLPAIIFCILLGMAMSMVGDRAKPIADLLSRLSDIMLKLVEIVMWYAPIGIGAYFAYLVGDFGPVLMGSYVRAMVLYCPLALMYWIVVYSLIALLSGGREAFYRWWRFIPLPAVTALGTCSSTATIPANLEAARKIGVPAYISNLVLPLGATMHMDGSCLGGVLKIAFAFGVLGLPFTPEVMGIAIFVAILSGVVLSGIPMGGYIGEMLIVSLYGFPPEMLPILIMIGTLIDPLATMINATGDTNAAMLIARVLEGKGWYHTPAI